MSDFDWGRKNSNQGGQTLCAYLDCGVDGVADDGRVSKQGAEPHRGHCGAGVEHEVIRHISSPLRLRGPLCHTPPDAITQLTQAAVVVMGTEESPERCSRRCSVEEQRRRLGTVAGGFSLFKDLWLLNFRQVPTLFFFPST